MSRVYWTGPNSGTTISGSPYKPGTGSGYANRGGSKLVKDRLNNASGSAPTTPAPPPFEWTFPQYSQSWAFTPPPPSQYKLPPQFDPKSSTGYLVPKGTTGSTTRNRKPIDFGSFGDLFNRFGSSMSLQDIWAKYSR